MRHDLRELVRLAQARLDEMHHARKQADAISIAAKLAIDDLGALAETLLNARVQFGQSPESLSSYPTPCPLRICIEDRSSAGSKDEM